MLRRRIQNVFVIMAASVALGLAKNIFIARELSKPDAGTFSLAMAMVGFIYPLSMFGQQNSLVRFFNRNKPALYRWQTALLRTVVIGLVFSGVVLAILKQIYDLQAGVMLFVISAILASAVGELFTNVTRSQGAYEASVLMQRSIRFVLPAILVVLYLLGRFTLDQILLWFGVAYLGYALGVLLLTQGMVPRGQAAIPKRLYYDGFLFTAQDLSIVVILFLVKFMIAKMLSLQDLAVYFAVFSIMRVYDLALQAIEYVLLPHSARIERRALGRVLIQIGGVALIITMFYLLFGAKLTTFIYSGKYDEGIGLIPLFVLVGIVRLFHSVPFSMIGGRLQQAALRTFTVISVALVPMTALTYFLFISLWGLYGAVLGTLVVWSVRTIFGFLIVWRYLQDEQIGFEPQVSSLVNLGETT